MFCKPFLVLHSHMLWHQWVYRVCWCMVDSKCKDSTLHIQAEQTQIQWKQLLLVCCFHDVYNLMARRICICWWQSHYPNWFPLLYMYSWCQSSAADANYHTDKKVYSFHQISMSCTNTTKYTAQVLERKVFRTDTFHLPYKYAMISEPVR